MFRAQFGNFVSELTSDANVRTSALEIVGKRVFSISSQMLINQSTNLADAMASAYKSRFEGIRARAKILTKFHPEVELSDTALVHYTHGPDDVPYLDQFLGKIISTRHDPMNAVSEFEVEQILS